MLDGVVDCGQLSVLLADQLDLEDLGIEQRPAQDVVAVMAGEGPQRIGGSYGADFHLYPWQATNPATGLPERERFTWLAPGGSGSHSLPADFQPSAIETLHDCRVMTLVGPNAEAAMFTRSIPAVRSFGALRASVDVRSLSEEEAAMWLSRVRQAVVDA